MEPKHGILQKAIQMISNEKDGRYMAIWNDKSSLYTWIARCILSTFPTF